MLVLRTLQLKLGYLCIFLKITSCTEYIRICFFYDDSVHIHQNGASFIKKSPIVLSNFLPYVSVAGLLQKSPKTPGNTTSWKEKSCWAVVFPSGHWVFKFTCSSL